MSPETIAAIADPTRREILDRLLERPHTVGELVGLTGQSQPGTSKHLRVLREAGLVRMRKQGRLHWHELNPEPLSEIDDWLEPFRRRWEQRLDRLDRELTEYQREESR